MAIIIYPKVIYNYTHDVHIRLKNERIDIEEDWTEQDIANELLTEGIPKSDIVLAFKFVSLLSWLWLKLSD